jgi:hypothetical protein
MRRGKSPSTRGGVPGPAAKKSDGGDGGKGKAHVSEKNVAQLVWLFMLVAVTINKGQKILFFMSSIIAFAALKYLSDLDEKHPMYKSHVFGAFLVSAVAFCCFDMVPYFESDEVFLKWFVDKMPEIEKVHTFAHKQLKMYSHGKPVAGVKKTVLDNDTFHGVLMKLRTQKNTKLFGIF